MDSSPGVYWFTDQKNNVLYVGKAKNLLKRIQNYQPNRIKDPKTKILISKTAHTNFQTTTNEFTAILLEAHLIQTHRPPYNIIQKDDKSPIYILITDQDFPRILTVRKTQLSQIPSQFVAGPFRSSYTTRHILKQMRKVFPYCNQANHNSSHKACLYHHLHLCPGACVGKITTQEYQAQYIRTIRQFLQGKQSSLTTALKRKISHYSKEHQFELAQQYKIQLQQYQDLIHAPMLSSIDFIPQLSSTESSLALESLKEVLHSHGMISADTNIDRIEFYDVAHHQAAAASASMIVSINGEIQPSQYRHFSISSKNAGDDFASMREVIERRQNHPEWGYPQLIILDGGQPQIAAVAKSMNWNTPIIGLAKGPDRLIMPTKLGNISYPLTPSFPATKLLSRMRDEAHRFARRLFHKRYERQLLSLH